MSARTPFWLFGDWGAVYCRMLLYIFPSGATALMVPMAGWLVAGSRASLVYCAALIGCQGVLLWGWQPLSTTPNWLVCSCPPKGPELNLLVMASISWLDKIPLPTALSLSPPPFPLLGSSSLLKSCRLISLPNREVHADVTRTCLLSPIVLALASSGLVVFLYYKTAWFWFFFF